MVTFFASTAPCRIALPEVMGHIATLEQAARAVHEGYLGNPLYQQAAHTARRLLALVEAMAWDEGTRIAHEIMCLFQTATFGLVQALHLSELIAAFYRGMAQVSAGQTPYMERDVRGMAPLLAIGLGTLRDGAEIMSFFISACILTLAPQHFSVSITHGLKNVAA